MGKQGQPVVAFTDTVGFGDNNSKQLQLAKFIKDFEGGINVALFLIPCGDTRLPKNTIDSLNMLFLVFGKCHLNGHLLLVLTQSERLVPELRQQAIRNY
jgi:predicted GTPase